MRVSAILSVASLSARKIPRSPYPQNLSATHRSRRAGSTNAEKADGLSLEYVFLEDVEQLELYRPGGYHPITVGDRLHSRYRVVDKLGHGDFSTVWLARDEKASTYVAIKILMADIRGCNESKILTQLASVNPGTSHPGKDSIPTILDEFIIKGPNGNHECVVTVPASTSLSGAREASYDGVFQLSVARAISAQLTQSVAFLHSQGIVHADVHPDNVLLHSPRNLDGLLPEELYAQYGSPDYEAIVRLDNRPVAAAGVPTHATPPTWLGKRSESITLPEAGITLSDLTQSFYPSATARHYSTTSVFSAPPEAHFSPDVPLSFPSDIWSLACTIWSIIGERPPFEGFAPSADCMARDYVTVLGILPAEWWESWHARPQWFKEDGTRNDHRQSLPPWKEWEERFEQFVQQARRRSGMEEVENEEKAALLTLLKSMLAFRPGERLTAQAALESKWMKEWALPELDRTRKVR